MKSAFRDKYGGPEVLTVRDIEKPVPKENEVLVKVKATTVNRTDYGILAGSPFIMRLFFTGYPKPRDKTTGTDFSGIVEAVGNKVSSIKPGDRVMGFGMGAKSHAEWLVFAENKGIVAIPPKLNFEEAAASIEGAYYAQNAVNYLKPKAGQTALVNGSTGAIGSACVQFLKYYGVKITAVCGGENRELVMSLGADRVIDYKTEDFLKDKEQYDFIFNHVPVGSFNKIKHLLKPNGVYLPSDGLENFLLAPWTRIKGGKKVIFSVPRDIKGGLLYVTDMIRKGAFRPVIDRTYPLTQIKEAFEYVATCQKIGNVILKTDEV